MKMINTVQLWQGLGIHHQYLSDKDQELITQHIIHSLHEPGVSSQYYSGLVDSITLTVQDVDCVIIGCTDLVRVSRFGRHWKKVLNS